MCVHARSETTAAHPKAMADFLHIETKHCSRQQAPIPHPETFCYDERGLPSRQIVGWCCRDIRHDDITCDQTADGNVKRRTWLK